MVVLPTAGHPEITILILSSNWDSFFLISLICFESIFNTKTRFGSIVNYEYIKLSMNQTMLFTQNDFTNNFRGFFNLICIVLYDIKGAACNNGTRRDHTF